MIAPVVHTSVFLNSLDLSATAATAASFGPPLLQITFRSSGAVITRSGLRLYFGEPIGR